MSQHDENDQLNVLRTWQDERSAFYLKHPFTTSVLGPKCVTCLVYYFRDKESFPVKFPYTEIAIYETWRHFGILKTVIVTNINHPVLMDFADRYRGWIEIQVDDQLVPGNLNSLSVDCCSRLHKRFRTPYVLMVQDDGFPLRSGIERFLGHYDFVGAPWRRRNLIVQLAGMFLRHWPSNGGFSLRSRKICELVSFYWNRDWRDRPFVFEEQTEDIFYTRTLPDTSLLYRFRVNVANSRVAALFSYDASVPQNAILNPLGFHGARAFKNLHALRLL